MYCCSAACRLAWTLCGPQARQPQPQGLTCKVLGEPQVASSLCGVHSLHASLPGANPVTACRCSIMATEAHMGSAHWHCMVCVAYIWEDQQTRQGVVGLSSAN